MIEAGVVINHNMRPLYWHLPPGRNAGHIPDTQSLWEIIWENRAEVKGFAHSHPGGGVPGPSNMDLASFQAMEAALGRRLDWWIASSDAMVHIAWYKGSGMYVVTALTKGDEPAWADELRRLSVTEATCKHQWWNPDDDGKYTCMHCGTPQTDAERAEAAIAAQLEALQSYMKGEMTAREAISRIVDESGWIPPKGTVHVGSVCGTPEYEETEALLHKIRVQCDKSQFWNALALTRELMGVLMKRFDAVLKGRP